MVEGVRGSCLSKAAIGVLCWPVDYLSMTAFYSSKNRLSGSPSLFIKEPYIVTFKNFLWMHRSIDPHFLGKKAGAIWQKFNNHDQATVTQRVFSPESPTDYFVKL